MEHLSLEALMSGLPEIKRSPENHGAIEMIVRRPSENQREILNMGEITNEGLKGDNWNVKPSSSTPDGSPNREKQITIMNSRAIAEIAGERNRWALAGDQIYADLNLGYENLPPGTQLKLGNAIVEVTAPPHRGCKKFAERFGQDAMRFVNSEAGRELNLRGINCRVIQEGSFIVGDLISKLEAR